MSRSPVSFCDGQGALHGSGSRSCSFRCRSAHSHREQREGGGGHREAQEGLLDLRPEERLSIRRVHEACSVRRTGLADVSEFLWAEKDFICASESFRPGSYVVFLQSVEPNEWIPVNHYMGGLRIEKNVVTWPYDEMMGSRRSLDSAKAAVLKAKVSVGQVRFRAEIVGSFWGLYNRWMPSRSHQVLVFHLMERALPSPWPAEHLFARAVVPREIAGREEYESWVKTEGRLEATANWVDGSLVIKEARRIGGI